MHKKFAYLGLYMYVCRIFSKTPRFFFIKSSQRMLWKDSIDASEHLLITYSIFTPISCADSFQKKFFEHKAVNIFLSITCLIETVPLSTHNIGFSCKLRKSKFYLHSYLGACIYFLKICGLTSVHHLWPGRHSLLCMCPITLS